MNFRNDTLQVSRTNTLLEQIVVVDGQAGSGKSMFTSILPTFDRVELYNYCTELENLCALFSLGKIPRDSCETMIKIQLDLVIYETMMSRRTNFRYSDVSSAFNSSKFFEYFFRLFSKGDMAIPKIIKEKKPILNFLTHNLLPVSKPLFESAKNKLTFIEIIRHPLYMLIQQTYNQINFYSDENKIRQFHVCFNDEDKEYFSWNYEDVKEFKNANPVERAIIEMYYFEKKNKEFKENNKNYLSNILTIPFEQFVKFPQEFIGLIENKLNTFKSRKTDKYLKKHKIPRKKLADSIPLDVYKRCGWQPPDPNLDERGELKKRREFAITEKARKKYLNMLDEISYDYEQKNMKNII